MIKQRATFDCFLACLAMATNRPYEEMFDPEFCAKIEKAKGTGGKDMDEAIRLSGLTEEDYKCIYSEGLRTSGNFKQILWGRKAIIQVPSLNIEEGMHCIFWTGSEILDPSNKQVYHWLSHVSPVYVWIFKS